MKAVAQLDTIFQDKAIYTTNGTYTFDIASEGLCTITLIGAGGGSAYVDGGTDNYSDTSWSNHYGHSGGNGAVFNGVARLTKGTLSITVGKVGTNRAGKGNTEGDGGDSYVIFTPENGEAIEIVRAGGGKSGYPTGSDYKVDVDGGIVTYNSDYIVEVIENKTGAKGTLKWTTHI